MKFFQYLESLYVVTNLELQENYTPYLQAKTQAVQKLINGQRWLLRHFAYVDLIFSFLLVKVHISAPPPSPKEIHDKAQAAAKLIQDQVLKEQQAHNEALSAAELVAQQERAAQRAAILPDRFDPKDASRAEAIAAQLAIAKASANE